MKKRLPLILIILLFLAGAGIFLYPTISNYFYERNASKAIQTYQDAVAELDPAEKAELLEQAAQYNDVLTGTDIEDPFNEDGDKLLGTEYSAILNLDRDGIMGYIEIPKIDVHLPIFHGTRDYYLRRGAGHIVQTSVPIGREGDHAALTSHRGLSSAKLFTDLDQLETGDLFFVYVLDEVLAYEVDQILVVEPSDTEALRPVAGYDYVTLVTCTPYAINSHRMLVRGVRTDYTPPTEPDAPQQREINWIPIVIGCFAGLWGILGITALVQRRRAKMKRSKPKRGGGWKLFSSRRHK